MLMPKKVKFRKQQRGRMAARPGPGARIAFGDYGLKASECGWVTAREIEAGRIAITRFIKRNGRIWIRMFPDKPYTKKPQETRMGKGKGAPEGWVMVVKPGRILYEMEGVPEAEAREALRLAAHKLSITHPLRDAGGGSLMKAAKVREMGADELKTKERELQEQLFKLRVQQSIGQLDNANQAARDPARDRAGEDGAPREAGVAMTDSKPEAGSRPAPGARRRGEDRQDAEDGRGQGGAPGAPRLLRQDHPPHLHLHGARRARRQGR